MITEIGWKKLERGGARGVVFCCDGATDDDDGTGIHGAFWMKRNKTKEVPAPVQLTKTKLL